MLSKSASGDNIRFFLGLIFILPGLCLQFPPPQHSPHPDFSSAFIIAGFALWMFSTFLFVPLIVLTASAIIDLIPQISHQISHAVTVTAITLAVVISLWGWWRQRQAKLAQKKLG